jgi:D-alanine-D-alanine ligase
LQGIACVGSGILGSAAAMDKVVAKQLVAYAGVPIVPYVSFRSEEWHSQRQHWLEKIREELRFPLFVKPASLGSSVGIRKVNHEKEVEDAIQNALTFDEKILVETGLAVREIEFACLGAYEPKVTAPGEIGVPSGFYTYEEKYASTSRAEVQVPAKLDRELVIQGQAMSKTIFRALNLYGLARIDLFLTRDEGKFYFNEANTLPGFTSISQYPQLWEHSGYEAKALVSELLDLAIQRRRQASQLTRSIAST